MEQLLRTITSDKLRSILSGVPLDFSKFPESCYDDLMVVMAHCCLNGPVGVKKATTFPGGITGSIADLFPYGGRISNRSWAAFCKEFAVAVKATFPSIAAESQQWGVNGDLWPLWERNQGS
jgi:hypothetical protein